MEWQQPNIAVRTCLFVAPGPPPHNARKRLLAAQASLFDGRAPAALQLLDPSWLSALEPGPDEKSSEAFPVPCTRARLWAARSSAAYADHRHELAFRAAETAVALEPHWSGAKWRLGVAAEAMGQLGVALEAWEGVRAVEPGSVYAQRQLIMEYVIASDVEQRRLRSELRSHRGRLRASPKVDAVKANAWCNASLVCRVWCQAARRAMDWSQDRYRAFDWAVRWWQPGLLTTILHMCPHVDPSRDEDQALRQACAEAHLALLDRLMCSAMVHAHVLQQYPLALALQAGDALAVERLLDDPLVCVEGRAVDALQNCVAQCCTACVAAVLRQRHDAALLPRLMETAVNAYADARPAQSMIRLLLSVDVTQVPHVVHRVVLCRRAHGSVEEHTAFVVWLVQLEGVCASSVALSLQLEASRGTLSETQMAVVDMLGVSLAPRASGSTVDGVPDVD